MLMRRLPFLIPAVLLLLLIVSPQLVRFYVDWLWFGEVGYQDVFKTIISSQATLFTITFVLVTLWLFVRNLSLLKLSPIALLLILHVNLIGLSGMRKKWPVNSLPRRNAIRFLRKFRSS